jgi:SnoaL-like domain
MASPMPVVADDAHGEAEHFVRAFAALWDRPTLERFRALMHPEVHLMQPLAPPAHGIEAATAWFVGIQDLLPDIRIAVQRWSGTPEALFIEWTATATFGGRPVSWNAVDRFRLDGPAGWPHALRARLAPRRTV